ncbi:hypothetical protein [Flagellimonas zhangzhouensis]|uniref:Lipocalin-like domain-containing protein n=1 Tax=Flagellimonas zhangzhouensis TaxID=1073328 RepID=A0A1H2SKN6_9FLAO|nr:hypothetical protein [Allomuricauda zhangzhouensis]SDW31684.1 hypothetical protein SAMN04487892_1124 [Allomuricauda zhangzhouensis]
MRKLTLRLYALAFMGVALLAFQSCSEDAMPGEDEALSATDLEAIMTTDEIAGVADFAIAELYNSNTAKGATAAKDDCYSATYTDTGFEATFNNCVLNGTENVNGTVSVTYVAGGENASFTATYTDFYVGTIKINGTRTYTIVGNNDSNTISLTVESDMSVEMEDGTLISENGNKTLSITFGETLEDITITLGGSWTVEVNEDTYQVEILEDLQANAACEYATSGTMLVSKNGLAVTVDFGNGECDNVATLIYPNGATQEITL